MNVNDLLELVKLISVWRDTACAFPLHGPSKSVVGQCDGENHIAHCPVQLALEDVYAMHNKLRRG